MTRECEGRTIREREREMGPVARVGYLINGPTSSGLSRDRVFLAYESRRREAVSKSRNASKGQEGEGGGGAPSEVKFPGHEAANLVSVS